jgi:hypothetical protein
VGRTSRQTSELGGKQVKGSCARKVQVKSVIVLAMSIGLVGGAVSFSAEDLVFQGMGMGDVGMG